MLRTKLVTFKKKTKTKKEVDREKEKHREEKREKKTHLPRFHQKLIPIYLWSNQVEIWRRGSKLE